MVRQLKVVIFIFISIFLEKDLFSEINKHNKPSIILLDAYFENAQKDLQEQYTNIFLNKLGKITDYKLINRKEIIDRLSKLMISPIKKVQNEKLKEIEKLMKEGESLLYTDPKSSVSVLNKAKEELRSIIETIALNKTLREAYFSAQMLLARSYLDNGNTEKAEDILGEIIKMYGDEIKVTEENYHPNLVKIYNKVQKSMERKRNAGLKIKSTPSGCIVIINGKEMRGTTPVEFNSLYPGIHNLQLRCGKQESMIYRVELRHEQIVEKEIDVNYDNVFNIDNNHLALNFSNIEHFNKSALFYISRIKAHLESDFVILVGLAGQEDTEELIGMLIDLRNNKILAKNDVEVSSQSVSLSAAEKFMDSFFYTKKAGESRWYNSWLGWTMIGAGAVSWGVGAYFISDFYTHKSNAENPDWPDDPKLTPDEKYNRQLEEKDKGESAKTAAWILCSVGTAALAGGITLFILQGSDEEVQESKVSLKQPAQPKYFVSPVILPHGGGAAATIMF